MPDDKKAKDKSPATEPEQASKIGKEQEEEPAEPTESTVAAEAALPVSTGVMPGQLLLTYEQMERLRRKLKAKYH